MKTKVEIKYQRSQLVGLPVAQYTRLKMLSDKRCQPMASILAMLVDQLADANNVPEVVVTDAPRNGRPAGKK